MPLIVSTPQGVSGAFDLPGQHAMDRRAETPIFAPIPRHGRGTTQAAVLRPMADRIDTIYPVAQHQHYPQPGPSDYLVPPNPTVRVPSLNRKQSRAGRSAAKNIAEAKKRGWTGGRNGSSGGSKKGRRRKKDKKKERDFDAASSAAWTDVTTASARSGVFWEGGQNLKDKKCVVM